MNSEQTNVPMESSKTNSKSMLLWTYSKLLEKGICGSQITLIFSFSVTAQPYGALTDEAPAQNASSM